MRNIQMLTKSIIIRSIHPLTLGCLIVVLPGCVSRMPIPYDYSATQPPRAHAPALTVHTIDLRTAKSDLDKVIHIPDGVTEVLTNELSRLGLFTQVRHDGVNHSGNYHLRCELNDLRWEVPNYDKMLGTSLLVSVATGGIGGLAYGSTPTDILGHARVRFILKKGNEEFLNKEYIGTASERKAKLKSDTPKTYREMAAKALKSVLSQFTSDLTQLNLPPKS